MQFIELDLNTRYKIYAETKKVLRKYQKGIISGKLTSEKFVDNMLRENSITEILENVSICESEFRETYKSYVDTLIRMQNESLSSKRRISSYYSRKADHSSIFRLQRLLTSSGYRLLIPTEYLSQEDIESIEKFISTGNIDVGNEKIYNYVSR